jgi:hypothetical protein
METLMRNMGIVAAVVLSLFGTAHAQDAPSPDATVLPDLMVRGRPVQEAARDFVGRVGAPARGGGRGRWGGALCPGGGSV